MDPDVVWGGKWGRLGMAVLDGNGMVIVEGKGAVLGLNSGRPIVTNGDFATRLFPNYFGQYLFVDIREHAERSVTDSQCYSNCCFKVYRTSV